MSSNTNTQFQNWMNQLPSSEQALQKDPQNETLLIDFSHKIRQAFVDGPSGWLHSIIEDPNPTSAWNLFLLQWDRSLIVSVFRKYILGFPHYLRDPVYGMLLCRPKDTQYILTYQLSEDRHRAIYQWFLDNGFAYVVPCTFT